MRRIWLPWLAFAGILWVSVFSFSQARYTCSACRAYKVQTKWLGMAWSREEETECSRWYRANVEASHDHLWEVYTHCRRLGWFGLSGYGCTIGGAITMLSETWQIELYQHFDNKLEAKALFAGMGRNSKEGSRIWTALQEWSDQGYPGSWRTWWERAQKLDRDEAFREGEAPAEPR